MGYPFTTYNIDGAAGNTHMHATLPTYQPVWTQYAITNAMVTALGASTTGTLELIGLPEKTQIWACVVNVTTAETHLTTLTATVGTSAGSYADVISTSVDIHTVAQSALLSSSGGTVLSTPVTVQAGGDVVGVALTASGYNLSTAVATVMKVSLLTYLPR
jgi:hypothetical protein